MRRRRLDRRGQEGGSGRGGTKSPLALVRRSQDRRNHGLRPVCELIFPRSPKPAPDAKRRAEGAPNIPDKEGGSGRGDEVPPCIRRGGFRKGGDEVPPCTRQKIPGSP